MEYPHLIPSYMGYIYIYTYGLYMGYKPVKWVITDIPYHPVPIGRLPVIWGTSALSSAPRIFPQWKWPWNGQNVSWPAQRTHVSWPLVDYKAERHQIQFWSLVTFPYIIYIYLYITYIYILYIYYIVFPFCSRFRDSCGTQMFPIPQHDASCESVTIR